MVKQLVKLAVSVLVFLLLSGSVLQPPLLLAQTRQQLEQEILAATVRFEMVTWVALEEGYYSQREANGHGTVINGRYLLTHNHLDTTITTRLLNNTQQAVSITLYDVVGQPIAEMEDDQVTLAAVASETLVLDFGKQGNVGFLAAQGLASAPCIVATELAAGTEVAQVDWDGSTTYVKWVTVETTKTIAGTAVVQLSDRIEKGASGGGVYWNGVHIGNNWKTAVATHHAAYSHAALNAPHILNLQ